MEDLATINIMREVYPYLPPNLRLCLFSIGLLRNNFRYKGPVRNFRLLDNDMAPIVHLQLQNQQQASEILKLSNENLGLKIENTMLKLRIQQLEEEERLLKNAIYVVAEQSVKILLPPLLESVEALSKLTQIQRDEISRLGGIIDLLCLSLCKNLPEDKAINTLKFIFGIVQPQRSQNQPKTGGTKSQVLEAV
jgi:hypothetical protein